MPEAFPEEDRACRACGGPLVALHGKRWYCSDTCRAEGRRLIARKWREANRDLANQRTHDWYIANVERERRKGRDYAREHPPKITPERVRERKRMAAHGMTQERFDELLSIQGEACAVCRRADVARWHIDHDHRHCPSKRSCADCIRGILCSSCNAAIGALGDNLVGLLRAMDYLAAHEVYNPPLWLQKLSVLQEMVA